jgi:uncharacterized membrane protein
MNRAEFIASLAHRLRHLPGAERDAILADYRRYFDDGVAAGRSEAQIAESLGSPARLAAELSVATFDAGDAAAPHSTARTMLSLLALVILDGAAWLPLVVGALCVLLLIAGGVVGLVYGGVTLALDPFDQPLGGIAAVLLRALAYLSGGVAALALARAGVLLLARFFVRRHRHQRRAMRPLNEVSP